MILEAWSCSLRFVMRRKQTAKMVYLIQRNFFIAILSWPFRPEKNRWESVHRQYSKIFRPDFQESFEIFRFPLEIPKKKFSPKKKFLQRKKFYKIFLSRIFFHHPQSLNEKKILHKFLRNPKKEGNGHSRFFSLLCQMILNFENPVIWKSDWFWGLCSSIFIISLWSYHLDINEKNQSLTNNQTELAAQISIVSF